MARIPTPEEAAAIAAAVERFRAEMAPSRGEEAGMDPWHRAALIEGAGKTTTSDQLEGGLKWLS
jgi:hypothetical protein